MKNNDNTRNNSTQIITLSDDFAQFINEKKVTEDLKMPTKNKDTTFNEHDCYNCGEEHDDHDFDEVYNVLVEDLNNEHLNYDCNNILDTVERLCESSGKIIPKDTVKILEKLLLDSKLAANPCFLNRYTHCLVCSCNRADESYIQNALQKLKYIMDNFEDLDSDSYTDKYITCLSRLSMEQAPEPASQTILEMKFFGDKTSAWNDINNVFQYCLALEHLCCNQSKNDDVADAYETLQSLEYIVNHYEKDTRLSKCYASALKYLCKQHYLTVPETYKLTRQLEDLYVQPQNIDNDFIVKQYIISLYELGEKQKEYCECYCDTIKRAQTLIEYYTHLDNPEELITWYSLTLYSLFDRDDPGDIQRVYKEMTKKSSNPVFAENEIFQKCYDDIKQLRRSK